MFSPIDLVFKSSIFTQLLQSFSVSFVTLLHFLNQLRLEKVKIPVNKLFDLFETII